MQFKIEKNAFTHVRQNLNGLVALADEEFQANLVPLNFVRNL